MGKGRGPRAARGPCPVLLWTQSYTAHGQVGPAEEGCGHLPPPHKLCGLCRPPFPITHLGWGEVGQGACSSPMCACVSPIPIPSAEKWGERGNVFPLLMTLSTPDVWVFLHSQGHWLGVLRPCPVLTDCLGSAQTPRSGAWSHNTAPCLRGPSLAQDSVSAWEPPRTPPGIC